MKSVQTLALACVLAWQATWAGSAPQPAPLRDDHPFIGAWALTSNDGACVETYRIGRHGSSLITSGEEVAQTRFQVSDQPNSKGFYKWVDTIVQDNGKKDCTGHVTAPRTTTTSYVLMNTSATAFISCETEAAQACIGPFVRIAANEI